MSKIPFIFLVTACDQIYCIPYEDMCTLKYNLVLFFYCRSKKIWNVFENMFSPPLISSLFATTKKPTAAMTATDMNGVLERKKSHMIVLANVISSKLKNPYTRL